MTYGNEIDKSIVLHRQNLNVLFPILQYDQDVVGPFHGRIYARTNYGSVTQAIRINGKIIDRKTKCLSSKRDL